MRFLPFFIIILGALAVGAGAADEPSKTQPAAQENATAEKQPPTPQKLAEEFFALLGKSDVNAAYAGLTRGSKIAESAEELKALKDKTEQAIKAFGPITGYETVAEKKVGERLLSLTCVSLGRDFPLRWRLYFYRAQHAWRLVDLRVDDRIQGLFGEDEAGAVK